MSTPTSQSTSRACTHTRYATYTGEGLEVGFLTLREAQELYASAEFESDTRTITVGEKRL